MPTYLVEAINIVDEFKFKTRGKFFKTRQKGRMFINSIRDKDQLKRVDHLEVEGRFKIKVFSSIC